MKIIDIVDQNNYLDLFTAKKNIEDDLIALNKIDKPYTFEEFIRSLDFSSHIYVKNDLVIPFAIFNTSNETYIFITAGKHKTIIMSALEEINFDFSKLSLKTEYDVITQNLMGKPFFILNNKLYYN